MQKILTITAILIVGLINIKAHATEETDQIRQECETQVQSYGITDSEEYQQMLNDCIDSMSPANPMEQYESENLPTE